jgi:DNA polymerase-3 subunit delta
MKLSPAQTGSFLQKPDPAVRVVLVYGPDAGLVHERGEQLAKKVLDDLHDPFRVALLTATALADDPARLADEMAAMALGGGRRLVRVQHATEGTGAILAKVIDDLPATDTLLIIEAGDLDKRSKLRSICEASSQAVAIACYVEEGAARQKIVAEILQAEKCSAPRDVLAFLCDILPPDRLAMRSELDKLLLYVHGKNAVTMEDVMAIVQDAGAAELDDLIFAVGIGDGKRVLQLIDRLFAEQTSPVAVLRAAQRHFIRLQYARYQMDQGMNAADAVKKLQPPVFWKFTDSMTTQVRRWPAARLELALQRLYDAEAMVKRTGVPDQALCAQLLLGMAA